MESKLNNKLITIAFAVISFVFLTGCEILPTTTVTVTKAPVTVTKATTTTSNQTNRPLPAQTIQPTIIVSIPPITSTGVKPSGVYSASIMGYEQTLTFSGNTLDIYDQLDGRKTYTYAISNNDSEISMTDIVSHVTTVKPFQYLKPYECVVLYPSSDTQRKFPVQYYKK
jgi:hypothetical protein